MNLTHDDLDSRISYYFGNQKYEASDAVRELRELSWSRKPCDWLQDEEGSWQACDRNMFCLNEGTPKDNGFKFCPYCGKPITETPYKEEE